MGKSLSRGLVFAALMVVIRLAQGALITELQAQTALINIVCCVAFALVAFLWGLSDGRTDARANPDPDRRDDLAMTWLAAAVITGVLSGAVSWLISLVYPALYSGGLIVELTTTAAFMALLVFVPAVFGVSIGRLLTDRNAEAVTRHSHAYDDEYADTDVFAQVQDDAPTGEIPVPAEHRPE